MALAIITVAPTVIFAENNISSSSPKAKLRAVVHNVEQKVEQKVETKLQNVKANKDIRNTAVEARIGIATSTRAEVRDIRVNTKQDLKAASTTTQKHEIRMEMRKDVFSAQLNKMINQVTLSLNNLKQIRTRVEARIEKATQAGRNMSKAKDLLVTADAKILSAEQTINSLKSLGASTSTVSTTATSIIKLERPRQMGADAIKAVNEVRKALNTVIIAIAHDMGLKLGNATTTATSTNE